MSKLDVMIERDIDALIEACNRWLRGFPPPKRGEKITRDLERLLKKIGGGICGR